MIDRDAGRVVVEFSGNAFGTITSAFLGEHGLDPSPEDSITEQAFLPDVGSAFPFVIRGPIQFQDLT